MTSRAQRHARARLMVLQLGIVTHEYNIEWADSHPTISERDRHVWIGFFQRQRARHQRDYERYRASYQEVYGLRARIRRYVNQLLGRRQETARMTITSPIAAVVRRSCDPEPHAAVLERYERMLKRDEESLLARRARAIPVQQRIVAQCAAIPRHKALVPYVPQLLLAPPRERTDD